MVSIFHNPNTPLVRGDSNAYRVRAIHWARRVVEGRLTNSSFEATLQLDAVVTLGRYQLLRVVGRGGMGHVFEAWDSQLERRVAIKVLRAEHGDDLVMREARCLARVAHPNVVGVHDVDRCESLVFIAMELVDGPDLRAWLCERPRRWMDVLDRVIEAGRGLVAVHRAGLVHGDVKPGNVLIGRDGRVRMADFGLARVRSRTVGPELAACVRRAAEAVESELRGATSPQPSCAAPSASWLDEDGARAGGGTRPYMAPECLTGAAGHQGADQYSLCAMAWEALFGVRPFAGRSAEAILASIALARLERGRGRPRGMPAAVEDVLLRGLSEAPQDRWPTVEALLDALERARRRPRTAVIRRVSLALLGLSLAGLLTTRVGLDADRPSSERDCAISGALGASSSDRPAHARARDEGVEAVMLDEELVQLELLLARGRVQLEAGDLEAAWAEAQAATSVAEGRPRAAARAWAFLARVAARAGRCHEAAQALERLRADVDEDQAIEQLGWVLDIIHAFELSSTPACAAAERDAWTLVNKLSE